tara:strand:+ start:1322 stop:3199 length:1878 start_codon:yes stop_codon:yes gene_type:complete
MPIRIRYQNDSNQECTIRPTPLISISTNILKNGAGEAYGVTYSITLTGTLLPNEGTPYATDNTGLNAGIVGGTFPFFGIPTPAPLRIGPHGSFDNNISHVSSRPPTQLVPMDHHATALISKQRALRALFAQDGQRLEITDLSEDQPAVICFPRLTNIDFSEGPYVLRSDYTINLEADILFHRDDAALNVDQEGTFIPHASGEFRSLLDTPAFGTATSGITEEDLVVEMSGAFIADFSEDWSIEVDENGETYTDANGVTQIRPKSYRISHSLNATGKKHYMMKENESVEKIPAWESARKFVTQRLHKDAVPSGYPNIYGKISSGVINLMDDYGGFNCVRTENVSESAGTFSVTENWFLASGTAFENYNINLSTSNSAPFVSVNIDGNIKGLSTITPSGEMYGGIGLGGPVGGFPQSLAPAPPPATPTTAQTPYQNAVRKYNTISNSGLFGVGSDIYRRANNMVAVQLNSQPLSVSIGSNEYTGELSYSLAFDNRPTNIISGAIVETLQVSDTYPGDVFAIVPVIGRATGPILQNIGGRTEYKRDVSLNLVMDYTKIPYGSGRNPLILKKPSVVEPMATQIAELLREVSPNSEPGVRKCFVSPPSETWSPKDGNYSFNISFTYEMDK